MTTTEQIGYETVTTGSAYKNSLDVAEIAAALRAEFKAEFDKSIKLSVRISRYSMGCSLNVQIKSAPYPVLAPVGTVDMYGRQVRFTEAGAALLRLVERRVNAYNQTRRDWDYCNTNFYGHVDFARNVA